MKELCDDCEWLEFRDAPNRPLCCLYCGASYELSQSWQQFCADLKDEWNRVKCYVMPWRKRRNEKMPRYIDADALKDALIEQKPYVSGMYIVIDTIDAQPTADVVPVVRGVKAEVKLAVCRQRNGAGRWIPYNWHSADVCCSECNTLQTNRDSNYKTKYCPNCGVIMEVDKGE